MKSEPISLSDPQITAYALGELSAAEKSEFERRLAESPEARAELAEIRETIDWISNGLANEVPQGAARETISEMGDPRMSAYALGELEGEDLAEIEALVTVSGDAREELAGIEDTISCLKEAFAAEANQLRPLATAEVEDSNIVAFDFKKVSTRVMWSGLAAVFAGLVTVGSLISNKNHQNDGVGAGMAMVPAPAAHSTVGETPETEPTEAVSSDVAIPVPAPKMDSLDGNIILAGHSAEEPDFSGFPASIRGNDGELHIPTLSISSDDESSPGADFNTRNNAGSFFDFDSLEVDPFTGGNLSLPGFRELSQGLPIQGHYKLRNEKAESLPDAEYGHGNLQFTIRKGKKADGTPIETIKLIDTRIDPDGTKSVSEKEFVREGEKVGSPISNELVPSINEGNPQALQLTGFTLKDEENPTIADQISTIMDELSTVRDALDTEPAGAEKKALQLQMRKLIKRQQELAEQLAE